MGVTVHSLQFHNSVALDLNGILCSTFLTILERITTLRKPLFNEQLSYVLYGINHSTEVQLHCCEPAICAVRFWLNYLL